MNRYFVYGLVLETDWPLVTPLRRAEGDRDADLRFSVSRTAPRPGEWVDVQRVTMPNGEPYVEIGRVGGFDVMRIPNVGDAWRIDRAHVHFHLTRAEHDFHVEVALLGIILADWLECHGRSALHGAAVTDGVAAIAFLGSNRAGKTSLALSLAQDGWRLLSDDLLSVSVDSTEVRIHPSFPQIRLWPEQARRLLGTAEGLQRAHPQYEKLRVDLAADHSASSIEPLTALYLPRRGAHVDGHRIVQVEPTHAFLQLMANSFIPNLLDTPSRRTDWHERLAALLERVAIFELLYPDDLEALPRIARAVGDHARSIAIDRL